ncbi:MAG: DUF1566 domain-containing protein [Mariprofundaceae bacterium]|nr:DUF1566 domain-containing protein [Mariprofundaceae bacterium]
MEEMKVWMQRISRAILFMLLLGSSHAAVAACLTSITASTPTSQFTDHGNGTVTDNKTGLMWKQCSEGLSGVNCATGTVAVYTWKAALLAVQTLNMGVGFAGFTDWRVPNIKELDSIVEEQCRLPAINSVIFPATPVNNWYWSASPYAGLATHAWFVNFNDGLDSAFLKSSSNSVRLVRGGQ